MKAMALLILAASMLAAADIAGTYAGTVEIPAGTFQVTLTLEQRGDEISGAIATQGDSYPIQKGKVNGNKLTFEVAADQVYALECVHENGRLTGEIKPAGGGGGKIDVARSK
jgi:hypothetical protein